MFAIRFTVYNIGSRLPLVKFAMGIHFYSTRALGSSMFSITDVTLYWFPLHQALYTILTN